jgi:hypothetical protein
MTAEQHPHPEHSAPLHDPATGRFVHNPADDPGRGAKWYLIGSVVLIVVSVIGAVIYFCC